MEGVNTVSTIERVETGDRNEEAQKRVLKMLESYTKDPEAVKAHGVEVGRI